MKSLNDQESKGRIKAADPRITLPTIASAGVVGLALLCFHSSRASDDAQEPTKHASQAEAGGAFIRNQRYSEREEASSSLLGNCNGPEDNSLLSDLSLQEATLPAVPDQGQGDVHGAISTEIDSTQTLSREERIADVARWFILGPNYTPGAEIGGADLKDFELLVRHLETSSLFDALSEMKEGGVLLSEEERAQTFKFVKSWESMPSLSSFESTEAFFQHQLDTLHLLPDLVLYVPVMYKWVEQREKLLAK